MNVCRLTLLACFVFLTATGARAALPDGWQIGANSDAISVVESAGQPRGPIIRIAASDRFADVHRFVPHRAGTRLYKITGWMRTDLSPVIRAQFGIDYYDAKGAMIRQATTRSSLNAHLRWGLCSAHSKTDWTRYVAYAYDVPPNTSSLKIWCGVNPWDTPRASGTAWFANVRVEPVDWDDRWPLGFAPAQWKPARPTAFTDHVQQSGYVVSTTSYLKYVLPDMVPSNAEDELTISTFSLPAWDEPLSFAIHALKDLRGVRLTVSDLRHEKQQATIAAEQVDVRRVRYVYKKRHMMSSEYLLSPNHLEPFERVDIPAGRTQQFWLTVRVPKDAQPGRYVADVRVEPASGPAKTLRLKLQVLPIQTHHPQGLRVGTFSYHLRKHSREKLLASFRDMKAHGMTTTTMFNPGLHVPIVQTDDGDVRIVWDQTNRLKEVFEVYQEVGFPEPLMIIELTSIFDASEKFGGPLGSKAFARVYKTLFAQILAEQQKRGWSEFIVCLYDEGYPYRFTETRFARTRASGPILNELGIATTTHALNHPISQIASFESEFYDVIDVIQLTFCHPPVTVLNRHHTGETWRQYLRRAHANGKQLLFYNIDATNVHPEAKRFGYGVALWATGANGIINWHYQGHIRRGGLHLSHKQGNANMSFVFDAYGDYLGGPSIGWEAAREGVKDYTLLHTLNVLIDEAEQSGNAKRASAAADARKATTQIINRVNLFSIDTGSALALPGQWQTETFDEHDTKQLGGDYKIPNGLHWEDYDRLRRLVCDHILELQRLR